MTPTLAGRFQTRLLLAAVVGVPVALLIAALLSGVTMPAALLALAVVTALGMGWECVYHLVQQRRWDGDWPGSFALGVGVLEGLAAYPVLRLLGAHLGFGSYVGLFAATWVAMWAVARGPLSVFLPRWRHQGARVVTGRPLAGAPKIAAPKISAPKISAPKISMPKPALPQRGSGLLGDLLRPTRQQLVVLGGLAAMVVALVLLVPLVGPRTDDKPMSMADTGTPTHHGVKPRPAHTDVRATTWNTKHRVRPESLSFGAVGVDAELDDVRMTSSGVLGTPRGGHAAWFAQGAAPGQRGPAVVIGDADGVFSRLEDAQIGQRFTTMRSDGSVVRFVVDDVTSADATQFPSRRIYGHSLKPLARLISYDTKTGRNVIVFAHAVAVTAMAARS